MSPRKQRLPFDQVSEFDRGRIVTYRDCGLSFRKIGSRDGRNQTTVMRICDRWMQKVSARTIRPHLQQSGLSTRRRLLGLLLTQNHRRLRRQWCDERRMWVQNRVTHLPSTPRWSDSSLETRGERMLNSCVMQLFSI
ncbi:transposable element Tcb1 transposase [Trichonephila clavipes]|nr:transposable element Tcb1 transposase [Trichonephila clavipes]